MVFVTAGYYNQQQRVIVSQLLAQAKKKVVWHGYRMIMSILGGGWGE